MMTPTLRAAFRAAYDVCVSACSERGVLDRLALRQAMVCYVEQGHAQVIRVETHAMLTREAEAYIKKRHHASRPSAASIQRTTNVVTGTQPTLPTFESVLNEMYDLPDGSSVTLGSMSVDQLRIVVGTRRTQLLQDRAILGRLELILGEAVRRGAVTVRELLVAS